MPPQNLEMLTRTLEHEGRQAVILRPAIALVLYSRAKFAPLMTATADLLQTYLNFVQSGAIVSRYEPPPEDNEYVPGRWIRFDVNQRRALDQELRSKPSSDDNTFFSFVLSATADGQAGNHGVSFSGTNFAKVTLPDATSVFRFEFPWNLLDTVSLPSLVDLIEGMASHFPFCTGHAGMSFIHPWEFVPEARDEIHKLWHRFLGFDVAHNASRLVMCGKSPPAHWINLIDDDLVTMLGGEEMVRSELEGCEVKRLAGGLLIRGAKYPPVVDVNRQGLDIGRLPTVARALQPVRFAEGLYAGLQDADMGQDWLGRFDQLDSGDWDNG